MINYDVFISFKNSASDQSMTPDHDIAEKLQAELDQRGLNAFFSGTSIIKAGDSEYQRVIDEALDTAEILVVIGTKPSYIRSKWVEYEWQSFLNDILSGIKKHSKILTYTSGVDSRELPRALRLNQNYDMNDKSVQDIADFVVKLHQTIMDNYSSDDTENSAETAAENADITGETAASETDRKSDVQKKFVFSDYRQIPASTYTSGLKSEFKRLEIQSNNALVIDQKAIDFTLKQMSPTEKLNVLDVGCAYGFVTKTRFADHPDVDHVIAVDNNADVIDKAKDLQMDEDKILFYVMDIVSDDFEDRMNELLAELDIPKFDIIFSSLVLLHLNNPDKVLRRLRKFLKKDGYIIVRGSDDGSKLCHPHYDTMEEIIQKTIEIGSTSDRLNGRKLYTQLVDAGYNDVRVFSEMTDISMIDFDDREDLFKESFSYRLDFFKRRVRESPDDKKALEDLEWMKNALERFETQFFERNFWYCEYDYIAIGRK